MVQKMGYFLFNTAYFPSYWHMPFEISIIILRNWHSSCIYNFHFLSPNCDVTSNDFGFWNSQIRVNTKPLRVNCSSWTIENCDSKIYFITLKKCTISPRGQIIEIYFSKTIFKMVSSKFLVVFAIVFDAMIMISVNITQFVDVPVLHTKIMVILGHLPFSEITSWKDWIWIFEKEHSKPWMHWT